MSEPEKNEGLVDRFPELERLEYRTRRRIPVIQGLELADCGAACLAMVLGYYRKHVSLDQVREVSGTGRDGIDALTILNTARFYGMRGRGVRLELEALDFLERGAILHWEFNHFVVFEKLRKDGVEIVDPAVGRRFIPMEQFAKSFTGVALLLEPSEGFEPAKKKGNLLWYYFRKVLGQSGLLVRILIISLLVQLIGLTMPILTGVLVDRVVPRGDYDLLMILGGGLLAVVIFNFFSSMLRAFLLLHLSTLLEARLTLDFLDHLVSLSYSFFQRRSSGDLIMRLNSNATIRETLTSSALSTVLDGLFVILYLILLLAMSASMGLLVVILGAVQVVLFMVARRPYRDLMAEQLQTQARAQGYQVELLAGIGTLKASGAEGRAVEKWANLFTDTMNVSLRSGRLGALIEPMLRALSSLSTLAILGYGGYLVLEGKFTLGTMLALNALAGNFIAPLSSLVNTAIQIQMLTPYVDRLRDVLDTPPEQDREKVVRAPRLTGRIRVEEVSFRYGPLTPMVVKNVTLDIEPGQHVAIVGPSGSGKSTLASILLGLYQPDGGRILYDGMELASLDVHSVRSQLGIVTQHPYLFAASIRENILLTAPSRSMEDMVQAAKLAYIHDEISQMPMAYETILADAGASLSGGQRQRLALARALVHQPIILLLDEATSSLDTVTERHIQLELEALKCTRIVIAQRLSTIVNADLILVMKEGVVVERGNHEELLARQGLYAELVSAQVRRHSPG
ncbi:MAG: Lactococcin-G-processing and transport ATP-binding protein LagD [Phycisphaerae bacterium]|nr:Lactococcin-G-processing and transport ATP-binding protein LagD [Phycisphaerae bacterium]